MSIHGSTEFAYGDKEISFKGPFRRVPMPDAVKEVTGIDFLAMSTDEEARAGHDGAEIEAGCAPRAETGLRDESGTGRYSGTARAAIERVKLWIPDTMHHYSASQRILHCSVRKYRA